MCVDCIVGVANCADIGLHAQVAVRDAARLSAFRHSAGAVDQLIRRNTCLADVSIGAG